VTAIKVHETAYEYDEYGNAVTYRFRGARTDGRRKVTLTYWSDLNHGYIIKPETILAEDFIAGPIPFLRKVSAYIPAPGTGASHP
jgi:hypothetical protein